MAGKSKTATPPARGQWFDEASQAPMIEQYARKLESFVNTMADGIVEPRELQEQETRIVALMKDIEPQLNDELHGKVTQLLCELVAYDLMQIVFTMQQGRPKTVFRG